MSDVTHLFGGQPFNGADGGRNESPEDQLRNQMVSAGIEPPERIVFDGHIHRFDTIKKGGKSGWYCVHADGVPAGAFGDWATQTTMNWCADIGRELTALESMKNARFLESVRKQREEERKKHQESAALTVSAIWDTCGLAEDEHPYLEDHRVKAHGAKVSGDGRLIVPIYNEELQLTSLQYIGPGSEKKFHGRGAIDGGFWWLGEYHRPASQTVFVAEGYATACAVYEATGDLTLMAYSAHNLPAVVGALKARHPDSRIVVVADNDASGIGHAKASQAVALHGGRVVMPHKINGKPTDACDYAKAGGDLAELLKPKSDGWLVDADEFTKQPAPLRWLIKRWLPREGLIMIHGPSGVGKSFLVLDMCLHIAAGLENWAGQTVKGGPVAYLAGEGHHGLKSRVAGWYQKHQVKSTKLKLSGSGCELDTPAGLARVRDNLLALDEQPRLIVVDTLHRFLSGDENSSQDAKKMIDACDQLARDFGCAVLLVHHSGVSNEERARGSSAFKGALDVEMSITAKRGEPHKLKQLKQKDAELFDDFWFHLPAHQIEGWADEDGEKVSTAVVEPDKAPDEPERRGRPNKDQKAAQDFLKMFERAWWASGAEERDGFPYLTRAALRRFLETEQWSPGQIKNALRADQPRRLVGCLQLGEKIRAEQHGWIVSDTGEAAGMMTRKFGEG